MLFSFQFKYITIYNWFIKIFKYRHLNINRFFSTSIQTIRHMDIHANYIGEYVYYVYIDMRTRVADNQSYVEEILVCSKLAIYCNNFTITSHFLVIEIIKNF
jgi:hypothetical protein